jgi:hypothetical protein
MVVLPLWWQPRGFGEHPDEVGEQLLQQVARHRVQGWCRGAWVGRVPHQAPQAVEIPKDWSQCHEPLDLQHHIERAESETVAVDDERLTLDSYLEAAAASRAHDVVVVCHRHAQASAVAEVAARPRRRLGVHKVVGGPRVEQGEEVGVVDGHLQLHGAPCAGLDSGQCVQRHGRLVRLQRLILLDGVGHHLDDEELLAVLLVSWRESFITMKALIFLTPLGNLRRRETEGGGLLLVAPGGSWGRRTLRSRLCCVLLLIRPSKDDGVIEFGRLLELYVRAQGIAEAGNVELDLLVLRQRLVAVGELRRAP